MLVVGLGITLTAVLIVNLWERRGRRPADVGAMTLQRLADQTRATIAFSIPAKMRRCSG